MSIQVVTVLVAIEPYWASSRRCKYNAVRLAWGIPRLNANCKSFLLVDIVGIINFSVHFQPKMCPEIEGRIV